jgi:O-antigen ligase
VIYHYSVDLVKAHPIIGIGLGSFQTQIAEISKNDIVFQRNTLSYALHPHNIYLAMWLNLGIAGMIIFLILCMNFFSQIYKMQNGPFRLALITALTTILVHGLFDTTYFKNDLSAVFWLIIAIKFIYEQSAEEKIKNN